MKTSLVTPTHNRPEQLSLVVDCINRQTVLPDEWVIADSSGEPLPKEIESKSVVPITFISDKPDRMPSVCFNFSNAFCAATGDVCISIKDDDYYPPGYVETMCSLLVKDNMLACESRNTDYRLSTGYYFIKYTTDSHRSPGCCLFPMHSMAIRGQQFKGELSELLCKNASYSWPDLLCCRHFIDNNKYPHVIKDFGVNSTVSLKDYGIGLAGLCASHRNNNGMQKDDDNFSMFKKLLGEDWKRYEKYLGRLRDK